MMLTINKFQRLKAEKNFLLNEGVACVVAPRQEHKCRPGGPISNYRGSAQYDFWVFEKIVLWEICTMQQVLHRQFPLVRILLHSNSSLISLVLILYLWYKNLYQWKSYQWRLYQWGQTYGLDFYSLFVIGLKSIHFKNTVALSSFLSKLLLLY